MAKNKISDLRDHLFAQLERLGDDENMADTDKLETELSRAKAIADVSKQIVESAKVEVSYIHALKNAPVSVVKPTFLEINK